MQHRHLGSASSTSKHIHPFKYIWITLTWEWVVTSPCTVTWWNRHIRSAHMCTSLSTFLGFSKRGHNFFGVDNTLGFFFKLNSLKRSFQTWKQLFQILKQAFPIWNRLKRISPFHSSRHMHATLSFFHLSRTPKEMKTGPFIVRVEK